jgi:hypothetical protein
MLGDTGESGVLFEFYPVDDGTMDVLILSGENNSIAVNCASRAHAVRFVKRLCEAERECCSAEHHHEQGCSTRPTLEFAAGG